MQGFKKLFSSKLLLLFFVFFMISCCTTNTYDKQKAFEIQEESMIEKVKLSAVKISVASVIAIKHKVSTSTVPDAQEMDTYSGSGVILKHIENGSLILTAGHVCNHLNDKAILLHFPYYLENFHDIFSSHKFLVTDTHNEQHPAIMIALSKESDVCILLTTPINAPVITISKKDLRPSQRVYSVSYPQGVWQANYNPVLQGFYSGPVDVNDHPVSAFSMPTSKGCSGGLIANFDGELVGMIHSYHLEFEHITLGATLSQIRSVLDMSEFMYSIGKQEYQMSLAKEFVYFQESARRAGRN